MNFAAAPLAIPDLILLTPKVFRDPRGQFSETYRKDFLASIGRDIDFVQENHAISHQAGTVRGLHFQRPPAAQTKLVRVVKGAILDVAVDIRRGSPTYGQSVAVELTAAKGKQLLVPQGFAHGFCTLEPDTEVLYKCDSYYAPELEGGLRYDDPALGIVWSAATVEVVVNDRDASFPGLSELDSPFTM
ncbi:dTDP-4-dehydrorhamnose 3,5-epimerase [Bauldia litoralis]|uniref:dTDP-4-dehydrorhamnose 3,5-epimerase n=1 Tax=Bauldia litoralis TaxID=665467 RepID=A0A1G6AKR4_9HYPH|nr:dTDP-4-dehydrorhamnose 3,5-epimerase [Bauldia litoralis]SDB08703.1 dTDP-4-dehydrorhamnose 3,5-epimerase [Bauldia litoralis]